MATVNQTIPVTMAHSSTYLPLSQQLETPSAKSAQSVSNIIWLNETLQPFMARDAFFSPFGPISHGGGINNSQIWSAQTTRFSVNVSCEVPISSWIGETQYLKSSWGCNYRAPPVRSGSGLSNDDDRRNFDALYVG